MNTRTLGPWQVSPIGLGLMNVSWSGGAATDPIRLADSAIPGIHAAIEAGITLFDTADIYAPSWDTMGHNELFLREALDSWSGPTAIRDSLVIATKGGITRSEGEVWGRNGSLEYLIAAAEASRERLGVEKIDLWQHHRLDPLIPYETQVENVLELKARGIVAEVGVSNHSAAQLRRAIEVGGTPEQGGIISVQNEFSPFYTHDLDVLEVCEEAGLAYLPWSPLGGSRKVASLAGHDRGEFASLAAGKGVSTPAVVLAWLLAYSPVIIPIPGATRAESIRDCYSAQDLELSAEECAALTESLGVSAPRSDELEPTPAFRD
jgi:aryl-alcohol dehydrogenase-like predicted oxidoreductase